MIKFIVVAEKWNEEKECVIRYTAGEFPDRVLARIFRDAYNETYCTNAKIKAVKISK